MQRIAGANQHSLRVVSGTQAFTLSVCVLLCGPVMCSDYEYTSQMMSFAYDRHLPAGMKWRDLFDMVSGCIRLQRLFLGVFA